MESVGDYGFAECVDVIDVQRSSGGWMKEKEEREEEEEKVTNWKAKEEKTEKVAMKAWNFFLFI